MVLQVVSSPKSLAAQDTGDGRLVGYEGRFVMSRHVCHRVNKPSTGVLTNMAPKTVTHCQKSTNLRSYDNIQLYFQLFK